MRIRPATPEDAAELGRALKIVVDEERWLGIQPPVTDEQTAGRIRDAMAAPSSRSKTTGPTRYLVPWSA